MRLIDADKINPMRCPRSIAEMREWIDAQPTITKWIPVSERLPEEEAQYLCVRKTCGGLCYEICRYIKDLYKMDKYDFIHKKFTNGFYAYDSEYGYLSVNDVIAWMPISKYKGEVG